MTSPPKLDPLALLISAVLQRERAAAFKKPVRRMSKKRVDKICEIPTAKKGRSRES